MIEWTHDVKELADHLHLDQFALMGFSFGGPHAAVSIQNSIGDSIATL
jgi:hypothetical protein